QTAPPHVTHCPVDPPPPPPPPQSAFRRNPERRAIARRERSRQPRNHGIVVGNLRRRCCHVAIPVRDVNRFVNLLFSGTSHSAPSLPAGPVFYSGPAAASSTSVAGNVTGCRFRRRRADADQRRRKLCGTSAQSRCLRRATGSLIALARSNSSRQPANNCSHSTSPSAFCSNR